MFYVIVQIKISSTIRAPHLQDCCAMADIAKQNQDLTMEEYWMIKDKSVFFRPFNLLPVFDCGDFQNSSAMFCVDEAADASRIVERIEMSGGDNVIRALVHAKSAGDTSAATIIEILWDDHRKALRLAKEGVAKGSAKDSAKRGGGGAAKGSTKGGAAKQGPSAKRGATKGSAKRGGGATKGSTKHN